MMPSYAIRFAGFSLIPILGAILMSSASSGWCQEQKAETANTAAENPKLYVLAVGAGQPLNAVPVPEFSAVDAAAFAGAMQGQKGKLYSEVEVKLLQDKAATRQAILDGLKWISLVTHPDDRAAIFLSGQADNDRDGEYYFMPYDFAPTDLLHTRLDSDSIEAALQRAQGNFLFFVDTSHAGSILYSRHRPTPEEEAINEIFPDEHGIIIFGACTGREVALSKPKWGGSAFTKAVVEGLGGGANYAHTGKITANMLDLFIGERVKELTGGKQTPTTSKTTSVPDFPVALVK